MFNPRTPSPDHAALAQALEADAVTAGAAEAHGILTGTLCARSPGPWTRLIFGREAAPAEAHALLEALYRHTADMLENPDFEFAPLLPLAEDELSARVSALADWCRGFVLGFGTGRAAPARSPDDSREAGGPPPGMEAVEPRREQRPRVTPGAVAGTSAEAQEILDDLMKIAELSGEEDTEDEDSARAFEELAEYVRVGVQLLYEETHPAAAPDRT